jgi:glycine/D-amino acid oxidase-like deaminating enzyme
MTFANKRFAIVGAGLMGRLLSLSLAKRGAKVELFDKGDARGKRIRSSGGSSNASPTCRICYHRRFSSANGNTQPSSLESPY